MRKTFKPMPFSVDLPLAFVFFALSIFRFRYKRGWENVELSFEILSV
jgi:hypothetical protein